MKNFSNLNQAEALILNQCNRASKDSPVTRTELIIVTGLTDGKVRATIGDLRDKGYRICEVTGQKGYWLAQSEGEYQDFRKNYYSRAKVIIRRTRAMDMMCPDQMEMGF